MLATVARGSTAFASAPWEIRDARRIGEAGLALVCLSKCRPWLRHPIAEVAIFRFGADTDGRPRMV